MYQYGSIFGNQPKKKQKKTGVLFVFVCVSILITMIRCLKLWSQLGCFLYVNYRKVTGVSGLSCFGQIKTNKLESTGYHWKNFLSLLKFDNVINTKACNCWDIVCTRRIMKRRPRHFPAFHCENSHLVNDLFHLLLHCSKTPFLHRFDNFLRLSMLTSLGLWMMMKEDKRTCLVKVDEWWAMIDNGWWWYIDMYYVVFKACLSGSRA